MFVSLLVMVATVLGVGMVIPQVLRLRRTGLSDGVSPVWAGVGVALNSWWVAYAVGADRLGLVPVSVGGTVLYLAIARLLMRIDGAATVRPMVHGAALVVLAPSIALLTKGWEAAGVAIGLTYAVQFAPAAVTALRSETVAGVSLATWMMALVEAALWFAYGAMLADPALLIGGGGGAITSAVIVGRIIAGGPAPRRPVRSQRRRASSGRHRRRPVAAVGGTS